MKLKLGTRGSALAVAQSELIADALRDRGHEVELVRIRTGGDVERGSLTQLGGLGVFAAELRTALLDGVCDFAVHSLKDLPTAPVPGLRIAAIPLRADARDALCARDGLTFAQLPTGATVGTGSPRRVAQLRAQRPDLLYVDIRGNVGTRLARVKTDDLDAVVLAAAGLERLGMTQHITDYLTILPAPGQGALALECRTDDEVLAAELAALEDPDTRLAVEAERVVLENLGGGCAAPIAAHGHDGELEAAVFALDGRRSVTARVTLSDHAGAIAAEELMQLGAETVAELTASRPSRLAELHDDSSLWGGEDVLAGLRIFVPRADTGDLVGALRAAGAEVVAEPVQRRVTLRPEGSFTDADWVALTSPATLEVLDELGMTIPEQARVAAVGAATARAARERGIDVDLVPQGASSAAALGEAWPAGSGLVVIPGSALSSTVLAEELRRKGYAVDQFAVYTMEPVDDVPGSLRGEYERCLFDVVVILAGSMGRAVDQLLGWPQGLQVVAFGPPSAAALRQLGVEVAAEARTQDAEGLIHAIANLPKGHR
ncbi:hydroxymethylbilane synthase [Tessaracoccus sp. MC1865]|nr:MULTISPECIES: hydroxymethylbilane synthase [unclassified Tessaracoccus]MBB1484820.1 hydroxymethylbilane synthase [Tessaracoccus sp. MC1865]MBB1510144.1 hydroxymethylbilane synthase [Tessaracoccus sp. MC1756]QTO38778.1 hydroxymethylbilane synthase [Tessaracoccus sp. MC1865]